MLSVFKDLLKVMGPSHSYVELSTAQRVHPSAFSLQTVGIYLIKMSLKIKNIL